ncbi:uncharacterized protein LOC125527135 [Triticum urartu]|uniref:uncharacterized protein LOC125516510 n=1 Tax=Triticum urartu TaxID=4572 RepID=UPI002043FB8E|nr:uncharacterized protein LOC125516510 [Triticum urartu]XP_048547659.1 uncharacterized protein LOC125527135 [Triticum urartu]
MEERLMIHPYDRVVTVRNLMSKINLYMYLYFYFCVAVQLREIESSAIRFLSTTAPRFPCRNFKPHRPGHSTAAAACAAAFRPNPAGSVRLLRRGLPTYSIDLLFNHPDLLPPAPPAETASSAACLQRRCVSPGARRWVGRSGPSHGQRSPRTPSPPRPAARNPPSSSSPFGLLFPFFQFRSIGSLRSYSGVQDGIPFRTSMQGLELMDMASSLLQEISPAGRRLYGDAKKLPASENKRGCVC